MFADWRFILFRSFRIDTVTPTVKMMEVKILNSKLTVTEVDINSIIPYEHNPRNNEKAVAYVADSIRNFGFKVPIVIDKYNVIVTGHTRYKAALSLNMDTVPCIVATDLTPEQAKAFRIADNKVSEYSKWDETLLSQELKVISELNFDFETLGFQEWEAEQLLNPVSIDDISEFFVDKEPKEKKRQIVKCPLCGGEFEQ